MNGVHNMNSQLHNSWLEFLIKWEGYGYEENSWEVEGDVVDPEKVQEIYPINSGAPCWITSLPFQLLISCAMRTQHPREEARSWENQLQLSPNDL